MSFIITITMLPGGFAVSFPFLQSRLDRFKRLPVSRRWDKASKRWIVSGGEGVKETLEAWKDSEIQMNDACLAELRRMRVRPLLRRSWTA